MVKQVKRIRSIDELRGFAIGSMILVNFLALYPNSPNMLKHAQGAGYTFADVVAPLFMFILGLMYRKSYLRRVATKGTIKTWIHFVKRYFVILLIGLVGNCLSKGRLTLDWGVLQTIGMSGIIVLPLICMKPNFRLLGAFAMVAIYQFILYPEFYNNIINADHGGIIGTFSWATIILFSSVFGELVNFERKTEMIVYSSVFMIAFIILGFLSSNFILVSKHAVSMSYILLSVGFSIMVFVVFLIINDTFNISVPSLKTIGQNALLIYLLHYLLIKVGHFIITQSSSLGLVLLGAAVIYMMIYGFGYLLERKGIYFKV